MQLEELKSELLNGKVRPTYIFYGQELALQDVYIKKISELSGLKAIRIDSLKSIYNKLSAKTLIKSKPSLYIIRDDDLYHKEESSWERIKNGKNQQGNIIIFLYTNIDKRSKFLKEHEEISTEFDFLGPSILKARVQAITKWPIQYCNDLVNICNCNYGRIEKEIEKLKTLSEINGYSLDIAYAKARKQNMIHEDIGDIIFDFSNAIIDRNISLAYKYLNQLEKTDEGPIKLISVLYNSFRNVLLVQSTAPNDRNEKVLGISPAQIYVTQQKCNKYSLPELVNIVKLLQKVESGIKTGKIDVNFSMEYILSEIF